MAVAAFAVTIATRAGTAATSDVFAVVALILAIVMLARTLLLVGAGGACAASHPAMVSSLPSLRSL
eukprot:4002218-Alexandrium_andersonii.AAC.1